MVLGGVVHLVVDPEDDRQILVFGRGRDHDLLHTPALVGDRLGGVGEEAGALDDDLYPLARPVDRPGILLGEDLDLPAVDDEVVPLVGDVPLERTVVGVELEEMGVRLGVGEVVEGDDLHVAVEAELLVDGPVGEATDAAETVDADADGHRQTPGAWRRGGGAPRVGTASCDGCRNGGRGGRATNYTPARRHRSNNPWQPVARGVTNPVLRGRWPGGGTPRRGRVSRSFPPRADREYCGASPWAPSCTR